MHNKKIWIGVVVAAAIIASAASIVVVKRPQPVTIVLDGQVHTVPMEVQELTAAGYRLAMCEKPTLTKGESCVAYFTDSEGKTLTTDIRTFENTSEVQDGTIVDIASDVGNTKTSGMVVDGISFNSTQEEAEKVFGKPIYDINGDTIYARYINKKNGDMVNVVFAEGAVVRLEVCNTKGYALKE